MFSNEQPQLRRFSAQIAAAASAVAALYLVLGARLGQLRLEGIGGALGAMAAVALISRGLAGPGASPRRLLSAAALLATAILLLLLAVAWVVPFGYPAALAASLLPLAVVLPYAPPRALAACAAVDGVAVLAIPWLAFRSAWRSPFPRWLEALIVGVSAAGALGITAALLWRLGERRRALLAEANEATRRERQAVAQRDELLAVAAHELRTPLSALQLYMGGIGRLLERDPTQAPDWLSDRIGRAQSSARRLSQLVEQLLDLSRLDEDPVELQLAPTELVPVVRRVSERLAPLAAGEGQIRLDLGEGDPASGHWDPLRLEQIVENLLGNAVKYGEGRPIDVRLEATAERVRLSVRDRGIGIPPETQARIFERFERGVPTSHYGGFGLGLWISRTLAEAMGGSIRLDSALGEGSTFVVELPRDAQRRIDK